MEKCPLRSQLAQFNFTSFFLTVNGGSRFPPDYVFRIGPQWSSLKQVLTYSSDRWISDRFHTVEEFRVGRKLLVDTQPSPCLAALKSCSQARTTCLLDGGSLASHWTETAEHCRSNCCTPVVHCLNTFSFLAFHSCQWQRATKEENPSWATEAGLFQERRLLGSDGMSIARRLQNWVAMSQW